MNYFPIYLDLKGKKVLITGFGPETEHKIYQMYESGADVQYLSTGCPSELELLLTEVNIKHEKRDFLEKDLDGTWLVISTSEDKVYNKIILDAATKKNIFVNIVDVTDMCTFIFPAVLKEGDIKIAVSTSGTSPALAQRIRKEISSVIGEEFGRLAELMGNKRKYILTFVKDKKQRADLFRRMVNSNLLNLLKDGRSGEASLQADKMISQEIEK